MLFYVCVFIVQGKEKYQYETGYLLDIKTQQEYERVGGLGYSYDAYFPLVIVNGITYVGKTNSKLNEWIVGSNVRVRFNEEKTEMYLKRAKGKDFGVEVVKKVRN